LKLWKSPGLGSFNLDVDSKATPAGL